MGSASGAMLAGDFQASDLFTFQLDLTTERTTSTGWAQHNYFYVRVWNNDDGSIDGLAVIPATRTLTFTRVISG